MRYLIDPFLTSSLDTGMFKLTPRIPTPKPYVSTNATNPKIFGPKLWRILHGTAEQFNPSPLLDARSAVVVLLVDAVPNMIPCPTCREHYTRMTAQEKPEMLFRTVGDGDLHAAFRHYLLNVHNLVNQRKNKPIFTESGLPRYLNTDVQRDVAEYKRMLQPMVDKGELNGEQLAQFQALIDALAPRQIVR